MSYPVTGPARSFVAVTPSDTVAIPGGPARALYVGVSGDVTCLNDKGQPVLFKSMAVGWHPIVTARVNAMGTTADSIVSVTG